MLLWSRSTIDEMGLLRKERHRRLLQESTQLNSMRVKGRSKTNLRVQSLLRFVLRMLGCEVMLRRQMIGWLWLFNG
jgi:hypothetical protein